MLDTIINEYIQPIMKLHNFRKKGFQWNRTRGCFIDVITIQQAKHSTNDCVVFTLNLGVFVPSFFQAVWGSAPGSFVSEADCVIRLRLSALIQGNPYGEALDEWWTLTDSSCVDTIGNELRESLETKGIPFLGSFDNYKSIANHMRQAKGWQAKNPLLMLHRALAEWKIGEVSSAMVILDSIESKAWKSKVVAIERLIHGITD